MNDLATLLLKLPRNTDVTPEAAQTFLAAITQINLAESKFLFFGGSSAKPLALEIVLEKQQVHFQLTCHLDLVPFIQTQIQSNYPLATIEKIKDPVADMAESLTVAYLKLRQGDYYPLATYPSFKDVDPLSSVLSVLSKAAADDSAIVQYALESVNDSWQKNGKQYAQYGTKKEDGTYTPRADTQIIQEKISFPGFRTSIRVAAKNANTIQELISSFGVFNKTDGNSLAATFISGKKHKKEIEFLLSRKAADKQILNIQEIASLWHLPSEKIKTPSILWGTSVLSEPPHNLPISLDITPAEKTRINFFAKTLFKNRETVFGIKDADRLRHVWCVGKTGTGKSTMIANMAVDDLKKDRGLAVIDPHGDLCEDLLDYIPSNRINDTIYFNPADRDFPIILNPLEVTNKEEAELVVAGLMSIFTKVWANVWSARMEYILRNSFMTLTEIPGATLEDVLKLLANQSYRNKIVSRLQDQTLVHFWKDEFDAMPENLQKEAISPIQNKVGQFVTSPMIRRIIGNPKSSISIDQIMDEKKILLVNLSQGRLGEDNSALLGAMLITKFQLAAMHRVDTPKQERIPFHLYVDEFQNFATDSFIKILSEARKYGLALLLANQYMAQIPEHITKAILGNVGSIITFAVGADDARILHKEFAEVFSENDLVNLVNFQIAIKLMIDGHSTRPFLATTLALPQSINMNREKVIKVSRERWAKAAKDDNQVLVDNSMTDNSTVDETGSSKIDKPSSAELDNNTNDDPTMPNTHNLSNIPNIPNTPNIPNIPNTSNISKPQMPAFPQKPKKKKGKGQPSHGIPQNIYHDTNTPHNSNVTPIRQKPKSPIPPLPPVLPSQPGIRTLQGEKDLLERKIEENEGNPQTHKPPVQANQDMPWQTNPTLPTNFPRSTQPQRPMPQIPPFPPYPNQDQTNYPPNASQPFPQSPNQGMYPPYPNFPQYPPPPPAFDEEKARREAEEQRKKEEVRLNQLKNELTGIKKPQ